MNLEGSVIGNRYKIIEKIGNGGMATVYKALDQILNRYVAVKVLRDEFTTDEEFIKRFNAEAQSAARLTHPNIVSVYDVGQEYNVYYIVMELIQGKTLKEIIDEDGSLSWKWSVNIATQIASALEMAHRNHIVHRDIKPHNIMITEEGVAKVTDFGIAKAVSNSTITAFGTTLGSVHYFSPEHARGGYTDAKSDLYSLGVVMYEMVTGKVPFDADTPVSVALKHMQEEPVEPIKVKRDIPFAVNQIIMKALKKDPNERYQNATEIIRDLNMALKRPEGGFIESRDYENSYTQRIPTMDSISNKQPEKDEEEEYYTETFFSTHPKVKMAIIIGAILLALTAIAAVPIITINIINSSTKAQDVQIPNVVGLTAEEAKQRVESSKLVYKQEEAYSVDVEAGLVISQNPKYGNYSVKEGTEITVVVSKGIETVDMPKVVGKQFSDVDVELKELGLQIEKIEEYSDEVEAGVVISQEDEQNKKVAKGSTVKIHVSKGIEKVTVPSVEGKPSEEAMQTLEDLGLTVVTVTEENNSKENDIVLKQSIEAGESIEKGSSIKLTINKIEESKTGTVKINVKEAIKSNGIQLEEDTSGGSSSGSSTKKYKDPTIIIKVDEEEVYKNTVSQNKEDFTKEVSGKKRITIKVYINGIMIGAKSMDFTASQNPTVVYE